MEENLIPSYIVFPFILDSFNLLFFLMSMSLLAPMHRIPRNRKETEAKEEKKSSIFCQYCCRNTGYKRESKKVMLAKDW